MAFAPLPREIRNDPDLVAGCIGGAATIDEIEKILLEVGFQEVRITPRDESRAFIKKWFPGSSVEEYVVSATIEAIRPQN